MRHVLIADDDSVSRGVVASKLFKLAVVVEAEDGVAALQHIREQHFDLVIVDLDMPGLGGLDLIKIIRGYPECRHIPIIVLTGDDNRATFDEVLRAGATSFLNKPLNWQAFGAHIVNNLA
mgnify:CR=1 FL=1